MAEMTVWQDGERRTFAVPCPQPLSEALAALGYAVALPCGGRGACGKCAVRAVGALSPVTEAEKRAGSRLACQTVALGDCEVTLPPSRAIRQIETAARAETDDGLCPMEGPYGAAVDIGTTTVALKLLELSGGGVVGEAACLNPQTRIAADVVGRIQAALRDGPDDQRRMIVQAVERLLEQACASAGIAAEGVRSLVLTGNTTMLYLLTGRDPAPLSRAPFAADTLFGATLPLLGRAAYLPPCMDAFVGADITCAVLSSGMCRSGETALLLDVGTNGEMALWHAGQLTVCSTAAGPAFEGAGISCGCGSVVGAIDKVWVENGRLGAHTIGGAPAVGLCGSGLIDAVAAMLELEWIDETGATDFDELPIRDGVALLPKDVRSVQLAKGAIAAGLQTLLREAGLHTRDVAKVYVAGGFGSHMSVASAVAIGLIPRELRERVTVVGNAALSGAMTFLLHTDRRAVAARLAQGAVTLPLGGNAAFAEAFMEHMLLRAYPPDAGGSTLDTAPSGRF